MQNYWNRCDWLTQANPFKHVGTYESQILVDFMNNPDTLASLSALSHSGDLLYYYRSKPSSRSWRNFMKERGVSHTAILGHVGKLMCSPLGAPQHSPSVTHIILVWETDPPDVSLAISLGRQLEGGADSWRGAEGAGLAVTFGWVGGFVGWDIFRSHVQCFRVSYDICRASIRFAQSSFLKERPLYL